MRHRFQYLSFIVLLLCMCIPINAQQTLVDSSQVDDTESEGEFFNYPRNREERIVKFSVDMELGKDNYMKVTEHIRIYALGYEFKRGLRRSIPQKRTDKHGHTKSMPIYLQAIECDGEKTPWHYEIDEDDNYVVYIGDPNKYLKEGEYEYTITYIAPGHIGQFSDHDEIFWNLNGFDWNVRFDTLAANVYVPGGTTIKNFYAYTGKIGDKGEDYVAEKGEDGTVCFLNSRPLRRGENMSVVVEFSKGSQQALTWWQIWKDDVYAGLIALAFFLYCFISWLLKGIDPKKPTVIPQYTVPDGISAALAARIMYEGDSKQVMASLMSLLVKSGACIKQVSKDNYQISKGYENGLDEFDSCVQTKLFEKKDTVRTDVDYAKIAGLRSAVSSLVSSRFENQLYIFNSGSTIIATLLGLAGGFYLFQLEALDWVTYSVLTFLIVIYIWHFIYIGKFTIKGIEMRAKMEGLKMYIMTAEKLSMRDLTPEHFEDLLPYAVAFGVENKWCKQFEEVLKKYNYRPKWYDTSSAYSSYSSFFSDSGISYITQGFTKATQNSFDTYDSEQSSSSGGDWGGGSGGSSGGGGGGGGGGGW